MPAPSAWTQRLFEEQAAIPQHWLMSVFRGFCASFCEADEAFEGCPEPSKASPWAGCYL